MTEHHIRYVVCNRCGTRFTRYPHKPASETRLDVGECQEVTAKYAVHLCHRSEQSREVTKVLGADLCERCTAGLLLYLDGAPVADLSG